MSATLALPPSTHPALDHIEATTREQILRLVVVDGPITAAELAERLAPTTSTRYRSASTASAE